MRLVTYEEFLPFPRDCSTLREGHPLRNEQGWMFSHPSDFGRNGLFDGKEHRFLIWEKADCERLARWLLDPVAAVKEQEEDDCHYVAPYTKKDLRL